MLVEIYVESKYITTVDWTQVPNEGEKLVIDGTDYEVYARTWYIYDSSLPTLTSRSEVHIFLEEIKSNLS